MNHIVPVLVGSLEIVIATMEVEVEDSEGTTIADGYRRSRVI